MCSAGRPAASSAAGCSRRLTDESQVGSGGGSARRADGGIAHPGAALALARGCAGGELEPSELVAGQRGLAVGVVLSRVSRHQTGRRACAGGRRGIHTASSDPAASLASVRASRRSVFARARRIPVSLGLTTTPRFRSPRVPPRRRPRGSRRTAPVLTWKGRETKWANDTDGFVLAAQPGKSQGRPLNTSGSQPIRRCAAYPSCVLPEGPCPVARP